MIYATFGIVERNGVKYRLYLFAGSTKAALAQTIVDFYEKPFEATLTYFSSSSGKTLTRHTSNLGHELEQAHGQLRLFTTLLAKLDAGSAAHFEKENFEGSFEFFVGTMSLWTNLSGYSEGLPAFLDNADLFLFSQGLWDQLPKDFLQCQDEDKAFNIVRDILNQWNNGQPE